MSTFSFENFSDSVKKLIRQRTLKAGEVLFLEGSVVEKIYVVRCGVIKLVVYPEGGQPLTLYRAQSGEAFGEEHLMLDDYKYTAMADVETTVESINVEALKNDISANPEIALKYIECLCRRYYQLRYNFERIGIKSAKARVLHMLVSLCTDTDGPLNLSGKVKSLSDDLNLAHEVTYRALRDLEDDGVIGRIDGRVEILKK